MNKFLLLAAVAALLYTAVIISNATDAALNNHTAVIQSQNFGG